MVKSVNGKRGFGLMEIVASLFILSLLFLAVSMINISNHKAALRIATRNQAMEIGQRAIDSLQAIGLSRVASDTDSVYGDTLKTVGTAFRYQYARRMVTRSDTSIEGTATQPIYLIRSKKVELNVDWKLDGHTNSINLNTVVQ